MKKQPEHNRKNVPPQDTAKAPKSAVSRSMRTRAIVLAALFVLVGFGAVVYNLYQLQIVQHDELAARAETQQLADETITPNRGVIYDSDMKVLARSNKVWTVVASPRDMAKSGTNINDVAVKLAELLELDAQSILEKLQKSESNYQLIKRQIEKPVADAITAWITEYNASDKGKDTPVAGISLVQDAKRYYPYQTLASTIIGFVNADGDGVLGIESYYNDTLKGTAGRVVGMKNAWGYDLPNGTYEAAYDAEDGNGLVLTLNASIQSTLEKYLQNAVDQYHVENRAVGIVMDVNTGAILAMATMPDYNLQDPYTIADEALAAQIAAIADENERADAKYTAQWAQWRNKAVADLYYPGLGVQGHHGFGRAGLRRGEPEHLVHLQGLHHRGGPHHAVRAHQPRHAGLLRRPGRLVQPLLCHAGADDGGGDVLQLYAGLRLLRENGRRHGRRGNDTVRPAGKNGARGAGLLRLRPDDVHHAHPDDHSSLRRHQRRISGTAARGEAGAGRGREYR